MPLPSFLKRKTPADPAPAPASEGGAVEQARTRARRRLIGAIVLLAVGIVGFPLVFETQPRPIAPDIPIQIAQTDASQPPHLATAPPVSAVVPAPVVPAVEPAPAPEPSPAPAASVPKPSAEPVRNEAKPPVPRPAPTPAPAPRSTTAAPTVQPRPSSAATAPSVVREAAPSPQPPAASTPPRSDDGARALALLEGGASAQALSTRYVVQVGAYTEAAALHEARQKVEHLGFKTYTQVVTSDAGSRTRVRVGPFASREQAVEAGAKIKRAGLPVAILGL